MLCPYPARRTHLVVEVHAGEVPPAPVPPDLDQALQGRRQRESQSRGLGTRRPQQKQLPGKTNRPRRPWIWAAGAVREGTLRMKHLGRGNLGGQIQGCFDEQELSAHRGREQRRLPFYSQRLVRLPQHSFSELHASSRYRSCVSLKSTNAPCAAQTPRTVSEGSFSEPPG